MVPLIEYGYSISLHDENLPATGGLGYYAHQEDEVKQRVSEWNTFTQENCPHVAMLHGEKCRLCGRRFTFTWIVDKPQEKIDTVYELISGPKFEWIPYAQLRGVILSKNNQKLPGMLVVDLAQLDTSFDMAIKNYMSTYHVVKVGGNWQMGPWHELSEEDIHSFKNLVLSMKE